MKFGVNTFIWSATFDPSHFGLLPTIKEAGFDGVEIPLLRPKELQAASIRRAVEANGLETNCCTALVDGPPARNSSPAKVRLRQMIPRGRPPAQWLRDGLVSDPVES